ncbi:MAG: IS4 family transposase, partial [Bacteroidota bacterium]|nr:IS4 family transposase [Bacteroidota bacterium]
MNKSTHFFGQSVFGQLISLIDKKIISDSVSECQSDYRTKRFNTSDHLISMLFTAFSNSSSLREVSSAMLGLKGKTEHFQLKNIPYRSTLSDANKRRSDEVFAKIYYRLYKKYREFISDSRLEYEWEKRLEIIDSTTIGLYKDILKCVGRKPSNGKSKGGIKVHTQMNLQEQVPKLIWFSSAATNDHNFLKRVQLKKNQIAVFDKGYNDYASYDRFTQNDIFFVTRIKSNASYTIKEELDLPDY